jgi:predicted DCC family thiol-disulfide oxidoreductase YuxK
MTAEGRAHSRESGQDCLLIYDGECRLCVTTKEKLDRTGESHHGIRFVPYQSDAARQALGERYRPGRPDLAFLVKPSGEIEGGLDAFLPFVPALPGGPILLKLLKLSLVKRVAERGYRFVARHRYRLFGEIRR